MKRCMKCMNEYSDDLDLCPYCGYESGEGNDNLLHITPGTILNERYIVGKTVGYGGFGVTYIGWDNKFKQRVAIKEYLPSDFSTREIGKTQVTVFEGNKSEQFRDGLEKFVEEAKKLANFRNVPGIVCILDSFEANNTAYIVMEYLEGETLTRYLEREGKIPVQKAIEMLIPILKSLSEVHAKGIIHRDIAPDNIILTKDGQVKLIDFGAARYATTSHSRSLTVIIKQGYSPEEQYRSRGEQGPYTDVYALAAVIYKMITGITPPDALERRAYYENKKKDILIPISKNCAIDKNKENAILNALNIRIDDRTKNTEEFLMELTSDTMVKRVADKIKGIDVMTWPIWAKIVIPVGAIAVITLFVMLFTGKIGFVNNLITDYTMGAQMSRVPNVINCTVEEAQEKLEKQGLKIIIAGREVSDTIPANMVLRQSVVASETVDKGSSIEIYISATEEINTDNGTMPNIIYYSKDEAEKFLKKNGMIVKIVEEYNSYVSEGLVIKDSIGQGNKINKGDEIVLYISKGIDPALVAKEEDNQNNNNQNNNVVPVNTKIALNKATMNLYIGNSASLTVTAGSNNRIVWESSNTNVATVNNGNITAIGVGSTTITVNNGNSTAECIVTVADYSFALSETSIVMSSGESKTIAVSGVPSGAEISWSSDDESIANVSNGNITGISSGNTVIKAEFTSGGRKYTASCQVSVGELGIILSKNNISLYVGDNDILSAVTEPSGQALIWSSSDSSIVEVDSNGRITAVGVGIASITVSFQHSSGLISEVCKVSVNEYNIVEEEEETINLSDTNINIVVGSTTKLSASVSPSGTSLTWSSSNSSVVSVDSNGSITAVGVGTASITVSGTTTNDSCTVSVYSGDWSESSLTAVSGLTVETKKQYRSKNKETTTSNSPSLEGWELYDQKTTQGEWGAWSEWSANPVEASGTREVETRQVETGGETYWTLYYYKYYNSSNNLWYYSYASGAGRTYHSVEAPYSQITIGKNNYDGHQAYAYNGHILWWKEKEYYKATYGTEYRYRDKTANTTTYYYQRWTDWGAWQDESIQSSDTCNVETRTLYRYK